MKSRTEFTARLRSSEWDRKMQARIENERKDRMHIRVRIMAVISALFIGAVTLMANWWEEDATNSNLYTSLEEAASDLQIQVSFTE